MPEYNTCIATCVANDANTPYAAAAPTLQFTLWNLYAYHPPLDDDDAKATLNRAVGNILRKKFASNLFDQGPTDPAGVVENIDSPEHRALAREAARQGIVLLINKNVSTSPLQPTLPCFAATERVPETPSSSASSSSSSSASSSSASLCGATGMVVCPHVLGCVKDDTSARLLPHQAPAFKARGDKLTLTKCAKACAAQGYNWAGAENGFECWCGSNNSTPDRPYVESGCSRACDGNASATCGGFGYLTEIALTCRKRPSPAPTPLPSTPNDPLPAFVHPGENVAIIGQLAGCGAANSTSCIAKVSQLGGYTQAGARVRRHLHAAHLGLGFAPTLFLPEDHWRANIDNPFLFFFLLWFLFYFIFYFGCRL